MILRLLPLFLVAAAFAQEAAAPAAQKFDFQALEPGAVPDEYMATEQEAKFTIVADGANKVLELAGQPIVDGGMLLGKSVKGACTVSARIKATGKRRTHPKFGIGLHGISGPRLLIVPAEKVVKIVRNAEKEETVASAAHAWTSGTWVRLEMSIKPGAGGKGSQVEARVWADDQPRPEAATVTWSSEDAPGQGKASVWGAPYAELPIQFDDVEVK